MRRDRGERSRRGGREPGNRSPREPGPAAARVRIGLADHPARVAVGRRAPGRAFGGRGRALAPARGAQRAVLDGEWIDPDSGKVPFAEYASAWIEERPNLRPKTIRLYRYLLSAHLQPAFGSMTIAGVKEAHVRRWWKGLLNGGVSAVTAAKAYRLLKAVMNTAVDDGLIHRSPCRIKGAGQEKVARAGEPDHRADVRAR